MTPETIRTAVVTGAASRRGIGRATAHTLAAAGWNVAILDLDETGAKESADEVAAAHDVQTVGLTCDVAHAASVDAAVSAVASAASDSNPASRSRTTAASTVSQRVCCTSTAPTTISNCGVSLMIGHQCGSWPKWA